MKEGGRKPGVRKSLAVWEGLKDKVSYRTGQGCSGDLCRQEFSYRLSCFLYDMVKIRKIIKSKAITCTPVPQTAAALICFQSSNSFLCT